MIQKKTVLLTKDDLGLKTYLIIFLLTIALTTMTGWGVIIISALSGGDVKVIRDNITLSECLSKSKIPGFTCRSTKKIDLNSYDTEKLNILGLGMIYELARVYCLSNPEKFVEIGTANEQITTNYYLMKYQSLSLNELSCKDSIQIDFWTKNLRRRFGKLDGVELLTNRYWINIVEHISEYFRTQIIPILFSLIIFICLLMRQFKKNKVFNSYPLLVDWGTELALAFFLACPLSGAPLYVPYDLYPRLSHYFCICAFAGIHFSIIYTNSLNFDSKIIKFLISPQVIFITPIHIFWLPLIFIQKFPDFYLFSIFLVLVIDIYFVIRQKDLLLFLIFLLTLADVLKFFNFERILSTEQYFLWPTSLSGLTYIALLFVFIFFNYLRTLSNRSKLLVSSEVSARLVHDLRNLSTLPKIDLSLNEDLRGKISAEVVNRINKISSDYITSLKKPSSQKKINLKEAIISLNSLFESLVSIKGNISTTCSFVSPPDDFFVLGEISQIERCFENLILNCFDALSDMKSPQLDVEGKLNRNEYVISISDNGRSFPMSVKKSLYSSLPNSTKEGGLGIGLISVITYLKSINCKLSLIQEDKSKKVTIIIPLFTRQILPRDSA